MAVERERVTIEEARPNLFRSRAGSREASSTIILNTGGRGVRGGGV